MSPRETCVWLVDAPFADCKRQYASLVTQKDGDWSDTQVCYSSMKPGPRRVSGERKDPGDSGEDRGQGTLEAHTKKTIYGLKI